MSQAPRSSPSCEPALKRARENAFEDDYAVYCPSSDEDEDLMSGSDAGSEFEAFLDEIDHDDESDRHDDEYDAGPSQPPPEMGPPLKDMQKIHRLRYEGGYGQSWIDSFAGEHGLELDLKDYALGKAVNKRLASHFQIYRTARGHIGARYFAIEPERWPLVHSLVMRASATNHPINLNEYAPVLSRGRRECKFYLDIEGNDPELAATYQPGYSGPVEPFLPDILQQIRNAFNLPRKTLALLFMRPKPGDAFSFHLVIPSLQVPVDKIASFLRDRTFFLKRGAASVPMAPPGLHIDTGATDGRLSMLLTCSYKEGMGPSNSVYFVTSCNMAAKRIELPECMRSHSGLMQAASIMPAVRPPANSNNDVEGEDEEEDTVMPLVPEYDDDICEHQHSIWQKRPLPRGLADEEAELYADAVGNKAPSRSTHRQLADAIIRRHGTDLTSYTYQVIRADDASRGFPNGTFHRVVGANNPTVFAEVVTSGRVSFGLTDVRIAMTNIQWAGVMMSVNEYYERVTRPRGLALTGVSYTGFLDPAHLGGGSSERYRDYDIYVTSSTVIARRVLNGEVVSADDIGGQEAGIVYVPHSGEESRSAIPNVRWITTPGRMRLRTAWNTFARAVLRRGTPGHEMMGYNEVPALLTLASANLSLWAPHHRAELGLLPVPMLTGPPGRFKTKTVTFVRHLFGITTTETASQSGMFAGASLQRGSPIIIDDPKLGETKTNGLFRDLHQAANGGERMTRAACHRFYAGLMLVMNQMPEDIDEATKTRTIMLYYYEHPPNSNEVEEYDPSVWLALEPRIHEAFSDMFRVSPYPYMEAAKEFIKLLPANSNERALRMCQAVYAHALALADEVYIAGSALHNAFLDAFRFFVRTQSSYKSVSIWQAILRTISSRYGVRGSPYGPWNCAVRVSFNTPYLVLTAETFSHFNLEQGMTNKAFNSVLERAFEAAPQAFHEAPNDGKPPRALHRPRLVKSRAYWESLDANDARPMLDLRYVRIPTGVGACQTRAHLIDLVKLRDHFEEIGADMSEMGVLGSIAAGDVRTSTTPIHE